MNKLKKLFSLRALNITQLIIRFYKSLDLNEKEFRLLIQLFDDLLEKNNVLSIKDLAEKVGLNQQDCSENINNLLKKGFFTIEIINLKNQKNQEIYNLDQTFLKIEELVFVDEEKNEFIDFNTNSLNNYLTKELGRNLSAFEIGILRKWTEEKIPPEMIKEALDKALKQGNFALRNVDAMLVNKRTYENYTEDLDDETKNILDGFFNANKN